jgi:hypothetical protein
MFTFADSFDFYATPGDAVAGYWDGGALTTHSLVAGRFAGSQCWRYAGAGAVNGVFKNGANDSIHHIVVAFRVSALPGSTASICGFTLSDAGTAQCTITFRQDGSVALLSGGIAGAVLASWAAAGIATNTWVAFEFEVVIHNTAGSFTVRKNGSPSNDFTQGSLNTRAGTANNYANRLQLVYAAAGGPSQDIDDLLWRSDPTSVAWMGDVRAYVRMPASDASVQFARSVVSILQTVATGGSSIGITAGQGRYTPFTAAYDGAIGSATVQTLSGGTGNMKCSIFASAGGLPTTVLGSATPIVAVATGGNVFTFSTPVPVVQGVQYWLGIDCDTTSGSHLANNTTASGLSSTTAYASFPAASPATASGFAIVSTAVITVNTNHCLVNETLQDGATTYVYDSTVGHGDLYTIAAASPTPTSVVAVTTRGFVEKSDAGARSGAVQLKSGVTTAQSASTPLTSSFSWLYRTDSTDPNTGSAWTPAAVDGLQIGPVVTA